MLRINRGFGRVLILLVAPIGALALLPSSHADPVWAAAFKRDSIEAEHYETLQGMTESADLIVVGRINTLKLGRQWLADPYRSDGRGVASYVEATLEVSEVLKGSPAQSGITLEVFVSQPGRVDEVINTAPRSESIFFLRNKGVEARAAGYTEAESRVEEKYFRLVSSQGLMVNDGGRTSVSNRDTDFLRDLHGGQFATLVDEIRGLVTSTDG